jgi:RNA polymerase sigma-70 factor (ECF subfamily)
LGFIAVRDRDGLPFSTPDEARPMSLAALYLEHAQGDRRAAFAAAPDLDAVLTGLAAAGRAEWPALAVEPAAFIAFLARCLPAEAAPSLASCRSGDLYLVCAYGLGVPGAAEIMENHCMRRVRAALSRLGTPAAVLADVVQDLRRLLVEMQAPDPRRKAYEGRGELGGWLRVCAVREAGLRRRRSAREVSESTVLAAATDDPEMALLRSTHKHEIQRAFGEALTSLPVRDRSVLRYHFVEGLSIDRVGLLYRVHRATAARWIEHARETLSLRTRENLCRRMSLSEAGFQRILGLIESQIGSQLAAAAE